MAIYRPSDGQEDAFDRLDQANFDPVQYLNDTLLPLNLTQPNTLAKQSRASALQSSSTDVQASLSKLNTHSIRSSTELTALADDILRSANRLTYEVEVLRGDVNSLYELLGDSLKNDISHFVLEEATQNSNVQDQKTEGDENIEDVEEAISSAQDPEFIRQLRALGMIKGRLEAVIQVFGEALKWPIPPSEVNMASLISVAAPEFGVANSAEDDKAREYTRKLRNSITDTLDMEGGGATGLEAANKRVNDLKALSQVWKGTAEERARSRVIDSLIRLVEDRRKLIDARSATARLNHDEIGQRPSSAPGRTARIAEGSTNPAMGLFRNLQKLRDEIYQD